MHLIPNIYRGQGGEKKRHNDKSGRESNPVLVLLAVCLLYLNSVVSADQSDWKSTVPKRNYSPLTTLTPVYKPAGTSQRKSMHVQPHQQINNTYNLPYHQHHQPLQRFINSAVFSTASASSSRTFNSKPSSWYSSHPSYDSRMGLISTLSTSSTSASLLPEVPPSFHTFEAKPELSSSLPLTSSSSTMTSMKSSSSSSNNTSAISVKSSSESKMKTTKKKKRIQNKTAKPMDTSISHPVIDTGTSRTLLIPSLMAYLFPVFIAQLFGMGMIPAAALLTLPIFLLPFGIAAGVFLI